MKKSIILVFVLICAMGLSGCQKTVNGSEVYSFPEPTTQIMGIFYSQGTENEFIIGSEEYNLDDLSVMPIIKWFYELELTICEEPEVVEGAEHYSFFVNEEEVFGYQDRGSQAYIIVNDTWYEVKNPSAPPITIE